MKKEHFEKGDYIVTLINDGNCGKKNYCSKQRGLSYQLEPEIDTGGSTTNGNSMFRVKDDSGKRWRYATQQEIAEYDKIGKPYDVTTLVSKETDLFIQLL